MFLQHLADQFSSAWGKSSGLVPMWIKISLLLFKLTSMDHICNGEVGPVLMMELTSFMFL